MTIILSLALLGALIVIHKLRQSVIAYREELRNHTVYRQFLETKCGLERKDDRVYDRLKEHGLPMIERK